MSNELGWQFTLVVSYHWHSTDKLQSQFPTRVNRGTVPFPRAAIPWQLSWWPHKSLTAANSTMKFAAHKSPVSVEIRSRPLDVLWITCINFPITRMLMHLEYCSRWSIYSSICAILLSISVICVFFYRKSCSHRGIICSYLSAMASSMR